MSSSNKAALAAIRRDLLQTIPAAVKAEMAKAVDKAADEIVTNAKAIAPNDTGDLADSIRKEAGADELSRTVIVGGQEVDYATWVEFGSPTSPADPFFWLVVRSLEKRRNGQVNRGINKALKGFAG